jgi:hypothetical protein
MSDDLIEKAEALIESEQCEYEHCKLPEMICELVAEVKRLREWDKMDDLQIHNMDLQLIDKDAEIANLEKKLDNAYWMYREERETIKQLIKSGRIDDVNLAVAREKAQAALARIRDDR